jgi:hypothetical protein
MHHEAIIKEYQYRPKVGVVIAAILFFGLGAALAWNDAANNDRGLIINNIIELETASATIFYWVMFAFCALFVGSGLLIIGLRVFVKQHISYSEQAIYLPTSRWTEMTTRIPFDQITNLEIHTVNRQKFLYIYSASDKRRSIVASMMPSTTDFEELCEVLSRNVEG